jgi:uncharacterized protein YjbI with pentapeptide repeats
LSNDDRENVKTGWDALYLRPGSLAAIPEIARAWTSIALGVVLLAFLSCVVITCILLVRLGVDAVWSSSANYQEPTKNFLLAFASAFGAPFLVWRAWVAHQQAIAATQQARVALENHITGIFSKSVELLSLIRDSKAINAAGEPIVRSIPNLESRLGGLYSLERLLRESEKDQRAILETLCAYVRENSSEKLPDQPEAVDLGQGKIKPDPTKRTDIQAALTILGRRSQSVQRRARDENWTLDFRNSDLSAYDFSNLNFDGSDFSHALLNGANLSGASFANCTFTQTVLTESDMRRTNFRSSTFKNCTFDKAQIEQTEFSLAKIVGTDLRQAKVGSFDIRGADVEGAFGSFLSYAVDGAKKGDKDYFAMNEISTTFELLKKARYDENTNVSQAVVDVIALMTTTSPQQTSPGSSEAKPPASDASGSQQA